VSPLWTSAEIAAAVGGRAIGDFAVRDVGIDTRSLTAHALFVALRGPSRDGHDFVSTALTDGAAVMVSRLPEGVAEDAPIVLVEDTMQALDALGRAGRARSAARIVGVTGSVGKTGTKEALRHVLAGAGPTHASAASHNNQWGVPLSLARLPQEARFGVFEMGMNHAAEIAGLTRQVRPHVAVITWIAPAHLEYLGSIEAIADAKAEILEGLEPGGAAVLPRDSEQFPRLLAHAERCGVARILTFGAHADADWRLVDADLEADGSHALAMRAGGAVEFSLPLAGRHWVMNALAVLAAGEALGLDPRALAQRLGSLEALAGRGRRRHLRIPGGCATLIDESYNANPASMRAALAVLGAAPGRRLAALGDMLELGPEAPRLHADLAAEVEGAGIDQVFTCGPLMARLSAALPACRRGTHGADPGALVAPVRAALRDGDVLLVKGSLGSRMAKLVAALDADQASAAAEPGH
jgi:UDP-N-acetylmuramoyl-tripeptide--D-alanyl-D-alanine ligase